MKGRKPGEYFLFSSKEFRRIWLHCLRKYGKMLRHVKTNGHRRRTKWRERSSITLWPQNALPEIFVKVAEAKRMMQTGEADTVGAATEAGGDQPQRVLQVQGCGAALQRYEGGAHHHLLLYAQGQHRRALQRAVGVCHLWGQHPDHQPEHSHQRLRGGDHLRRDQRTWRRRWSSCWRTCPPWTAWYGWKSWQDKAERRTGR